MTDEPFGEDEEAYFHGARNSLFFLLLLFLGITSGYTLRQQKIDYLPESGAHMMIGMLASGLLRLFADRSSLSYLQFNPSVFFFFLLPPIIFEAGYTMKKKRFFQNILSILAFAVLGTFISSFSVGYLTYMAAKMNLIDIDSNDPLQALLFGSLISSVDPVAVLAIIGNPENNCDPLLYSLLFGESVLNDSVAIVLFHVFNEYNIKIHKAAFKIADQHESDSLADFVLSDMFSVIGGFLMISVASVITGISVGLICSFVFKNSNLREFHTYEIQILACFVFFCFAFAEFCEISGVVALFFFAVTLSHYNFYNLSEQSQISSVYVFESIAKLSEMIIFVYMGLSLFITESNWSFMFIILGSLFCLLGRALNVYPMSYMANLARRGEYQITRNMQHVMAFAGLRGAVSYALSTQLTVGYQPGIELIQTTCLGIIILSTFGLGGFTSSVLEKYEMKNTEMDASKTRSPLLSPLSPGDRSLHAFPRSNLVEAGSPTVERYRQPDEPVHRMRFGNFRGFTNPLQRFGFDHLRANFDVEPASIRATWRAFDGAYMKPIFGGSGIHQPEAGYLEGYHLPLAAEPHSTYSSLHDTEDTH